MQPTLPRHPDRLQCLQIQNLRKSIIRKRRDPPLRQPRHVRPNSHAHTLHFRSPMSRIRRLEETFHLFEIGHTRIALLPECDVVIDVLALACCLEELVALAAGCVEDFCGVGLGLVVVVRDFETVDHREAVEPVVPRVFSAWCRDFVVCGPCAVECPRHAARECTDYAERGWGWGCGGGFELGLSVSTCSMGDGGREEREAKEAYGGIVGPVLVWCFRWHGCCGDGTHVDFPLVR
jgi:hypothetical protein